MNGFKLVKNIDDIQPGDLFFTSHKGFVDRGIRIFTTSNVSHVGYVHNVSKWDGKVEAIETIEAFPPVVRYRHRTRANDFFLDEKVTSHHPTGIITIMRPDLFPSVQAVHFIHGTVGKPYDLLAVLRLGLLRLGRLAPAIAVPVLNRLPAKELSKAWMCSESNATYLEMMGYDITDSPYAVSPDDLREFCFTHLTGVI